jgi:hypothetical protein
MARGGHVLPKVSPGPTMPYPLTSCGRATSVAVYPFGHPRPYAYENNTSRPTVVEEET